MRLRRTEPHTLAGAYAMHALNGADTKRFERHLVRCPECAAEIAEFGEVAARLAAAAAAQPPPALKERAMAAAARVRQLPPDTGETGATRPAGRRPARPPRQSWPARLALAAGSAGLVLATIFGLTASVEQHQISQDQLRSRQVAAVLTARDAVMLDAKVRTGGNAAVVMSSRERALVFAATGLRVLPSSMCYELWLIGPSGDTPAGMLPAPRQGRTGPVIASGLASGDRLGLTIEPAGGSGQPTSPMILELAL
jgi:anti-sigma-K factor RskA